MELSKKLTVEVIKRKHYLERLVGKSEHRLAIINSFCSYTIFPDLGESTMAQCKYIYTIINYVAQCKYIYIA